jgi:predicted oxidoreductase
VLKENPTLREQILIVTKCGCASRGADTRRPYRYDFSREHILIPARNPSAGLAWKRLISNLLHRPDYLMDPLKSPMPLISCARRARCVISVVSNFRPSQLTALQKSVRCRFWSTKWRSVWPGRIAWKTAPSINAGGADYSDAWSPLAGGNWGTDIAASWASQEQYQTEAINARLDELAQRHAANRTCRGAALVDEAPV